MRRRRSARQAGVFLTVPGELLLLGFVRPRGTDSGHFHVAEPDRARWIARFEQLSDELGARRLGFEQAARALLSLLLLDAARLAAGRLSGIAPAARPLLVRVFQHIETRFAQPISLQDVARAVGRSPAHLTSVVKRETGRSVLEWIIERRMAEARRLLTETDLEVGEIGERVSYLDAGYFIRQFRRVNGLTPVAWRRAHREG